MRKPRIQLIAFDSFGVRSMATVIEVNGLKIFIDPGASYAPRRYGLPPHPIELETLEKLIDTICKDLQDSTHIIISHYHYDHYLRGEEYKELYRHKELFVKNPKENINVSQRLRAYRFFEKNGVKSLAKVNIADARTYSLDTGIKLEFSKPVPHGEEGTPLGYVIMTLLDVDGYRVVHTSDVQGPISESTLNILINWKPHMVILGGPPTYFEGFKISNECIVRSLNNMKKLVHMRQLEVLVVDHHSLRDLNYKDKLKEVFELGSRMGKKVVTAAEYMGKEPQPLEAMRKILWEKSK